MDTKSALALLCVICNVFIFLALTGCSNKDSNALEGEWVPTTATVSGKTIQYSELNADQSQFFFNFSSDGKCRAVLGGVESSGTYVFNETSVDVVLDGKDEKLKYEGGNLTMDFNYDNASTSITFTKMIDSSQN